MDRQYGKIPESSTGRLNPTVRPEVHLPTITILPPTTHAPQPSTYNFKAHEKFDMPTTVSQPYYFAEQQNRSIPSVVKCPVCFVGINFFRLPNDPTDSVFCNSCRQPYHFCLVHKKSIPGMGLGWTDASFAHCRCTSGQAFLNNQRWDSCFATD